MCYKRCNKIIIESTTENFNISIVFSILILKREVQIFAEMSPTPPKHKAPKGTKICPCSNCRNLKGFAAFQRVRTVHNHMNEERKRVSICKIIILRLLIIHYIYVYKIAIGIGERADRGRDTASANSGDSCSRYGT